MTTARRQKIVEIRLGKNGRICKIKEVYFQYIDIKQPQSSIIVSENYSVIMVDRTMGHEKRLFTFF